MGLWAAEDRAARARQSASVLGSGVAEASSDVKDVLQVTSPAGAPRYPWVEVKHRKVSVFLNVINNGKHMHVFQVHQARAGTRHRNGVKLAGNPRRWPSLQHQAPRLWTPMGQLTSYIMPLSSLCQQIFVHSVYVYK